MAPHSKQTSTDGLVRAVTIAVYIASALVLVAVMMIIFHKVTGSERDLAEELNEAERQSGAVLDQPTLSPWTSARVLKHFNLVSLAQLRWGHPVTTKAELRAALMAQQSVHVLELPVTHGPPEMVAHGPVVAWDGSEWDPSMMTLKEALDIWVASNTPMGLLLTILDPRVAKQALAPLHIYQQFGHVIGPVFVGAELLSGPGRSPPAMSHIRVEPHVSEAFRQAVPELRKEGLHPAHDLSQGPEFLPFYPQKFLQDCHEGMPGAFLLASWSCSAACPANYLPNPNLIGRRRLLKRGRHKKSDAKRPSAAELTRYTEQHTNEMSVLLGSVSWEGGVAFSVQVCHVSTSRDVWEQLVKPHNNLAEAAEAAGRYGMERWLLKMGGVMTEEAGTLLRERFSPHELLINVTDVEGNRIVL